MTYRRYPPPPPKHARGIWALILVLLAVLFANVAHQAGIG